MAGQEARATIDHRPVLLDGSRLTALALSDGAGVTIVDLRTRKIVGTVRPPKARGSQSFRWLADGRLQFVTGNSLATTDALGTDLGSVPRILGARICRATSDGGWVSGVGSELVDLAPDALTFSRMLLPPSAA